MNKDEYIKRIYSLSDMALKSLAKDIKAQEQIGLMSSRDAHDQLNCVSAVIMSKMVNNIEEHDYVR